MGQGKTSVFSAVVLVLTISYVALLPGYYEITQMAPVINAPREKVFRYLSDPRNFATLAPPELQPVSVAVESEGSSRVSGNCTREARLYFSLRVLFFFSIPWSAEFSEIYACPPSPSSGSSSSPSSTSSISWVEYRTRLSMLTSHRTTYFLEELVSVDGKVQTEVHERSVVKMPWLLQLVSEEPHRMLHALLLNNLKDVLECHRI